MKKHKLVGFASKRTKAAYDKWSARLRRAARHPQDVEAIHDLRVSIRRLLQCLQAFEDFFDPTVVKRVRKQLGKLMKSCGATRNCDIAQELFREAGIPDGDPAYANFKTQRDRAQKQLIRHLSKKRWNRFRQRNPVRPHLQRAAQEHWNLEDSVAANARRVLPALCNEFFEAGAVAAEVETDYAALHQFRLRTKRFRYTLEIFSEIYAAGVDRRLGELRELQDRLGRINDCRTTMELIEKTAVSIRLIRKLLARRDHEFRDYWHTHFAGKTVQSWNRWLGKPPSTRTTLRYDES